jgi:hypothetical protein
MSVVLHRRVKDMPGLTDTGVSTKAVTFGWADAGITRRMPERIGAIRTMTTTRTAGTCMKATGTAKIMAITTTIITTTADKIFLRES